LVLHTGLTVSIAFVNNNIKIKLSIISSII
jgi:hypothetical protein